jgi:hypothetical protein
MRFFSLIRHPASGAAPTIEIDAIALILATDVVSFRYRVRGDVRRIRVPRVGPAFRTDELWRRTCFEAFVKPKGQDRYVELNFAPSTEWAGYSFPSYRLGREPLPAIAAPTIECRVDGDSIALEATVRTSSLCFDSAIGLSAVIEDVDGNVSYWALAHPRAQADFHDSTGWTSAFQRVSTEGPT